MEYGGGGSSLFSCGMMLVVPCDRSASVLSLPMVAISEYAGGNKSASWCGVMLGIEGDRQIQGLDSARLNGVELDRVNVLQDVLSSISQCLK